MCFRRNRRVVVVLDTRTPRYAILFSTDLTLSPLQIYPYYQSRFPIEFLFRDAKQFTGLAACQARTATALHNHFNASLTAVSRIDRRGPGGIPVELRLCVCVIEDQHRFIGLVCV